jgi:hypothetical protein
VTNERCGAHWQTPSSFGRHDKAPMPVARSLESGSWFVVRNPQQEQRRHLAIVATFVTPSPPPQLGMSDEVRTIVDQMAERLAANVALLPAYASWISADGRVTRTTVTDATWMHRMVRQHLTVRIALPAPTPMPPKTPTP